MKRMKHIPIEEEDALTCILRHHVSREKVSAIMLNVVRDYNILATEDDITDEVDRITGLLTSRALVTDLGELIKWVHAEEAAKADFHRTRPPLLLAVLSRMGIYGKAVLQGRP